MSNDRKNNPDDKKVENPLISHSCQSKRCCLIVACYRCVVVLIAPVIVGYRVVVVRFGFLVASIHKGCQIKIRPLGKKDRHL